jgi:hypothetical protein
VAPAKDQLIPPDLKRADSIMTARATMRGTGKPSRRHWRRARTAARLHRPESRSQPAGQLINLGLVSRSLRRSKKARMFMSEVIWRL